MACKDCVSGTLHGGTPEGKVETVHGLPTYVSNTPSGSPKGIVVIIPDAFGWELPNSRIMADNYAKKADVNVLLPDFMNGNWAPHDLLESAETMFDNEASILKRIPSGLRAISSFVPFLFNNRPAVAAPRVYNFFRALRDSTKLPIAAAGFCWGGRWTTYLCSGLNGDKTPAGDPKFLVDCGFTAHPSSLQVPKDIEAVVKPLSIANGTKDIQLTVPLMDQVKEIFKEKPQCELVIYDGAKHGFAVRGNPDNEKELQQGIEAEDQAVAWFKKHFEAGSKL